MKSALFLIALFLGSPAFAQTDSDASYQGVLTLDEIPVNDPAFTPRGVNAPVLQAITVRSNVRDRTGVPVDLVPDFHFQAPNGNAVVLRRELIDTSGAFAQNNILNATINIPAAAQKRGAVISGGWHCGTQIYYVTIRAYILDADGERSNALQYTVHCNGG